MLVAQISYEVYLAHGYFINLIGQSNEILSVIKFFALTITGAIMLHLIVGVIGKVYNIFAGA